MGVWGCMYGRTGLQASPTPLVRQSLTAFYILYRTSHPHVLVTFAPKVTRRSLYEQTDGRTLLFPGNLDKTELPLTLSFAPHSTGEHLLPDKMTSSSACCPARLLRSINRV